MLGVCGQLAGVELAEIWSSRAFSSCQLLLRLGGHRLEIFSGRPTNALDDGSRYCPARAAIMPLVGRALLRAASRRIAWISGGYFSKYSLIAALRFGSSILAISSRMSFVFASHSRELRLVLRELVGRQQRQSVGGGGVGEERLEAVVVVLADRVVLVVVAAGAAEGQAEEDGADGVGDVVERSPAAAASGCGRSTRRGSGG